MLILLYPEIEAPIAYLGGPTARELRRAIDYKAWLVYRFAENPTNRVEFFLKEPPTDAFNAAVCEVRIMPSAEDDPIVLGLIKDDLSARSALVMRAQAPSCVSLVKAFEFNTRLAYPDFIRENLGKTPAELLEQVMAQEKAALEEYQASR